MSLHPPHRTTTHTRTHHYPITYTTNIKRRCEFNSCALHNFKCFVVVVVVFYPLFDLIILNKRIINNFYYWIVSKRFLSIFFFLKYFTLRLDVCVFLKKNLNSTFRRRTASTTSRIRNGSVWREREKKII
jgi:hypothetical protein